MSRIRSIHPGIFSDEAWAVVSIAARWFAQGIATEADDNGVFEWKPLQLKMRIFPADNVNATELLTELESAGIVQGFTADGKRYGAIRNFCKYQRPRKPKAWFPCPDEIRLFTALDGRSVEPDDGEEAPVQKKSEPVPHKSEKSPQMEDGVGEEKEEQIAPTSLSVTRASERAPSDFPHDAFESHFWPAYPNKVGKSAASSKFEAIRKGGKVSFEAIMAGVDAYTRFKPPEREWCNPLTWLNQGRWNDVWNSREARSAAKPSNGEQLVAGLARALEKRGEGDRERMPSRPAGTVADLDAIAVDVTPGRGPDRLTFTSRG
jgi:hypothetical protein